MVGTLLEVVDTRPALSAARKTSRAHIVTQEKPRKEICKSGWSRCGALARGDQTATVEGDVARPFMLVVLGAGSFARHWLSSSGVRGFTSLCAAG